MFDLRSDTVTKPTAAMREAMARAEVGDDVFGEDPTLNRLEQEAAGLFGKDATLFVPSGTMGNQLCLGALVRPGDEVLAEARAHILVNEVGSVARLWGCQIAPVVGERGCLDPAVVETHVRDEDIHHPVTRVLSVENTHNYAGGVVVPLETLDGLVAVARRHELKLHMDGARLMNAAVASGEPVARIVRDFDLVSVCLSKGLGAPVGSLVVGSHEDIAVCRKLRKALGGGMRQAGVLAAAARIALEEGPGLMAHDHRRARALAEAVGELPGAEVDLEAVQTNLVFVKTLARPAVEVERALAERGVMCCALGPDALRLVFHRDVGDDALEAAVDGCRAVLG